MGGKTFFSSREEAKTDLAALAKTPAAFFSAAAARDEFSQRARKLVGIDFVQFVKKKRMDFFFVSRARDVVGRGLSARDECSLVKMPLPHPPSTPNPRSDDGCRGGLPPHTLPLNLPNDVFSPPSLLLRTNLHSCRHSDGKKRKEKEKRQPRKRNRENCGEIRERNKNNIFPAFFFGRQLPPRNTKQMSSVLLLLSSAIETNLAFSMGIELQ